VAERLSAYLPRLLGSTTSPTQYLKALARFRREPFPPGRVLDWVCRDDERAFDAKADRVELRPAQEPSASAPLQSRSGEWFTT
jgi:hypothetical protein